MSWQQLWDVLADATAEYTAERDAPPAACPTCGEPLSTGPDGGLFCRFDGWRVEDAVPNEVS